MVVALLALVAPEQQPVGEHEAEFAVEQVDIDTVGLTSEARGPLALPSSVKG
jgi:hypothetical protein